MDHLAPSKVWQGSKAEAALAMLQILGVVLLWVVFLVFQQVKSRYNQCSKTYLLLFFAELVLLLAFTALGTPSSAVYEPILACVQGVKGALELQGSGTFRARQVSTRMMWTLSCGRC